MFVSFRRRPESGIENRHIIGDGGDMSSRSLFKSVENLDTL